jgi:SAM-dependent methyltransferase
MNKVQYLFSFDERVKTRKKKKEFIVSLIYSLLAYSQWKHLPRWFSSLKKGKNPFDDEQPWMSYSAIDFIGNVINKNSIVFEYGSGGSTLYFAERAKKVISVEHDKKWHSHLSGEISRKKIKNVEYLLYPPTTLKGPEDLHNYFRSWREQGVSFTDYVTSISKFPDNTFDLISVDGRARVACVRESYKKVKNGGYIVLDNSARKDYFEAFLFLRDKGCEDINYFGLLGYETPLNQTTIWKINK